MERENMNFNNIDFFKGLAYFDRLPGLFDEFADQFKVASSLIVNLKKEIVPNPNKIPLSTTSTSEDGLEITIIYKGLLFFKEKTKLTDPPTPAEVYSGVKRLLEKAVNEDNERFEQLNLNQEEE